MKTIGQMYKEKVLSLAEAQRVLVELPPDGAPARVVQDLFSWKLQAGRRSRVCRSQDEARYLRVSLDAGMSEVYVPTDDAYLARIVPGLERLKAGSMRWWTPTLSRSSTGR